MVFTIVTTERTFEFQNFKGMTIVPESRLLAILNEDEDLIAQINPSHIIAMWEGPVDSFVKDIPKNLVQLPKLIIPGGR